MYLYSITHWRSLIRPCFIFSPSHFRFFQSPQFRQTRKTAPPLKCSSFYQAHCSALTQFTHVTNGQEKSSTNQKFRIYRSLVSKLRFQNSVLFYTYYQHVTSICRVLGVCNGHKQVYQSQLKARYSNCALFNMSSTEINEQEWSFTNRNAEIE